MLKMAGDEPGWQISCAENPGFSHLATIPRPPNDERPTWILDGPAGGGSAIGSIAGRARQPAPLVIVSRLRP